MKEQNISCNLNYLVYLLFSLNFCDEELKVCVGKDTGIQHRQMLHFKRIIQTEDLCVLVYGLKELIVCKKSWYCSSFCCEFSFKVVKSCKVLWKVCRKVLIWWQ